MRKAQEGVAWRALSYKEERAKEISSVLSVTCGLKPAVGL